MSNAFLKRTAVARRRSRSRRGRSSVEYAIMFAVVIVLTGTFATMGNQAFVPVRGGVTDLYVSLSGNQPESNIARSYGVVDVTPRESYFLMTMALVSIASICFIGKSVRTKNKPRRSEVETDSNSTTKIKTDGNVKLRDMIYQKRDVMLTEMQGDLGHVLDGQFEVSHLMSTKMRIVAPDYPAVNVRKMMSKHKMHHLLVCKNTRLLGVISDRDLTRKPNAKTAAGMMTRDPISVQSDNCLIPTVSTMINKRISCLPVVDEGELKGVLTRTDLLVAFQCFLQIMSKLVHESEGEMPAELRAEVTDAK